MRGSTLLIFILAIPALAALGHDAYLFFQNGGTMDTLQAQVQTSLAGTEEPGVRSFFATGGWIWTQYKPESYKWVAENTNKDTWAIINLILAQKAVLIGAAFAGFFYSLFILLRLVNVGPFRNQSRVHVSDKGSINALLGKKDPQKFKYKRK
jgi:hypothetical protein